MKTEEITNYLLDREIKPSYPRIQILKFLTKYNNHPTVDQIYSSLVKEIPTLSKTTVYNTLDLFEDKGIVKSLNLEDKEKHYELMVEDHLHFKCQICNNIFDIPYKEDMSLLPEEFSNFEIKESHLFLKGICENCNID